MLYSLDTLTKMVRMAMARAPRELPLLHCHDPDMLDLDMLIRIRLPEAVQYVFATAPIEKLADAVKDMAEEGVYWHPSTDNLYSGHVLLPSDYLRLCIFEMSDWHKPVYAAIHQDSPYYDIARSPYSGIRGTPYRPVCLLSQSSEGSILEFFSCLTDKAQIVQAKYLPYPKVDQGFIDIPPRVLPLVISKLITNFFNDE